MVNKDINGIIIVDKQEDFTSHDCVAILRRKLGIKRIGHTGTLDPMARGVVTLCIGSATRITDYTDWDLKEYRCKLTLGIETDTDDIWGKVISEKEVDRHITESEISDVFKTFLGKQKQVPPMYSAIKVAGKKLYEYARSGKSIDVKERDVYFDSITLVNLNYEADLLREIEFDILCSKGTYIRSLCKDIGRKLGQLATMSSLIRTRSGKLSIDDAISITDIKDMNEEEIKKFILPTEEGIANMKKLKLSKEEGKDFTNGKKLSLKKLRAKLNITEKEIYEYFKKTEDADEQESSILEKDQEHPCEFSEKLGFKKDYFKVYVEDEFIGVGKIYKGAFVADKVFNIRMQNENI